MNRYHALSMNDPTAATTSQEVRQYGTPAPFRALRRTPAESTPTRLAFRHSRRGWSVRCQISHPPSCIPSLHPHYRDFAATMDALTPARPALRPSSGLNSVSVPGQVSPLHSLSLPIIPSPTTRCLPSSLSHPTPQRDGLPVPHGSGLRHSLAGSSMHQGRIEFVSYGLIFHLQLLPTYHHWYAVTFGYGPERACPERTLTSLSECARGRTSALAGERFQKAPASGSTPRAASAARRPPVPRRP